MRNRHAQTIHVEILNHTNESISTNNTRNQRPILLYFLKAAAREKGNQVETQTTNTVESSANEIQARGATVCKDDAVPEHNKPIANQEQPLVEKKIVSLDEDD